MAISLLASIAFTLWWLWFFVRRDRHPEPLWLLARTFAWGMFAWLVAAAFETSLRNVFQETAILAILIVMLLTAVIEEVSKFLAASTSVHEAHFDEPMDGLVYAVTAALGFALLENMTYTMGFGIQAGAWHAIVTTFAHALFSAPQGYALGGRHWNGERWWRIRGLSLSIALHFVFNGLLSGDGGWPTLVALVLVVLMMTWLASRYYLAFEAHARLHGPSTYFLSQNPEWDKKWQDELKQK